jgi:hypothetical protein
MHLGRTHSKFVIVEITALFRTTGMVLLKGNGGRGEEDYRTSTREVFWVDRYCNMRYKWHFLYENHTFQGQFLHDLVISNRKLEM